MTEPTPPTPAPPGGLPPPPPSVLPYRSTGAYFMPQAKVWQVLLAAVLTVAVLSLTAFAAGMITFAKVGKDFLFVGIIGAVIAVLIVAAVLLRGSARSRGLGIGIWIGLGASVLLAELCSGFKR